MFTDKPMTEIKQYQGTTGKDLNTLNILLAEEVTKLTHAFTLSS